MYLYCEHWPTLQIVIFVAAAVIARSRFDEYLPIGVFLQHKSKEMEKQVG